MTPQEIFDTVSKHLLTQNAKSEGGYPATQCLYRNPQGLKCAVGCLIPDSLYKPAIEGLTVHHLVNLDNTVNGKSYTQQQLADLARLGFTYDNEYLLNSLQRIHDRHSVTVWQAKLAELADNMNLNKGVLA